MQYAGAVPSTHSKCAYHSNTYVGTSIAYYRSCPILAVFCHKRAIIILTVITIVQTES